MERSQYNERYSLPDPCGSESRSTRYRAKKRARELEIEQQPNTVEDDSAVLEDWEVSYSPVCDPLVVNTPEPDAVSSEVSNSEQPQLLEFEAFGFPEVQYESEDDEVCPTTTSSERDPPLYSGAPLTLCSSNLLIMQYKMRHKLTDESLADLLQLLKLHLPTPNRCLPSVYYFKRHFRDLACSVKFHYFCSSCSQAINEPSSNVCSNQLCCSDLTQPGARSSFIQKPIQPQLQTFFCRECMNLWCYVCIHMLTFQVRISAQPFMRMYVDVLVQEAYETSVTAQSTGN